MTKVTVRTKFEKLNQFRKGFIATHLIDIGRELGIFEVLKDAKKKGLTVSEIAEILGLHEPYLKIWCQTAYFFEILDYDQEGRYKLERFIDKLLADETYILYLLQVFNLYVNIEGDRLKTAAKYYKNGGIAEEYSPERSKIVANSSKRANLMFPTFLKQHPQGNSILQTLEQGTKFLDIGCGSGILIIHLAESFQNSKFVGIDPIKHGIRTAQNKIQELGLEDRVSVECLGGQDLPYENEFGLISMIITLHEIYPDNRYNLLEKAFQALKKDGQLIIFDFSYPDKMEDFRNPNYELGIIDQFFETSLGTKHINVQEQNEMLTNVGFKDIQRKSLELMGNVIGLDIISAKKE